MLPDLSTLQPGARTDAYALDLAQPLFHPKKGSGTAPSKTGNYVFCDVPNEQGNLVLLLPIGLGPEKYGDGTEQELACFRAQPHPAVAAVASLDGESIGRSTVLNDVLYQARTLGGTVMEGIRQGKAVFRRSSRIAGVVLIDEALRNRDKDEDKAKAQAIVGGALLLLSALTAAEADVRHWPTLPSTVQVITAEVPPG